eukprot:g2512.t1
MISVFTRRNCSSCKKCVKILRDSIDQIDSIADVKDDSNSNEDKGGKQRSSLQLKILCCEMIDPALLCVRLSGSFSVPQVFFNEVHIGGYKKTRSLADTGELHTLLTELSKRPPALDFPPRPKTEIVKISSHFAVSSRPSLEQFSEMINMGVSTFVSIQKASETLAPSMINSRDVKPIELVFDVEYPAPERLEFFKKIEKALNTCAKPALVYSDDGRYASLLVLLVEARAKGLSHLDVERFFKWVRPFGLNLQSSAETIAAIDTVGSTTTDQFALKPEVEEAYRFFQKERKILRDFCFNVLREGQSGKLPSKNDSQNSTSSTPFEPIRDMNSQPSKGNRIHPSDTINKDNKKVEDANRGIQKKISLLDPESRCAKEIGATLSKNAKLEKEFSDCFPTPKERHIFFRATRFLEKHSLHFSPRFLRGMRSHLEDDRVEDATAKVEQDFGDSDYEKVKVKEMDKEKDALEIIDYPTNQSVVERMIRSRRQTAEIKFRFKRVITSNHEPYEVFTKDSIGKWVIGEKLAKRLLNTTKGLYAIPWFICMVAAVALAILFLSKTISDTYEPLLIVPFLFCIPYSLIMVSSINIVLCKKLLQEFMFWYTVLSFIVGASVASVAFSGAQRLALMCFIPLYIVLTIADPMPRFFVKNIWYGYVCAIVGTISTIIALKQLPNNPKFNFHLPVFGTYSWIGVAITALFNYIIMMTKLLVVSLWNPKNLAMLKVQLQSNKMIENRANMILVTADKEKLYKKIGEDGQKLVTQIVGSPSDVPWQFRGKTLKSILFTRLRTNEKSHVTSDTEFKLEFYVKKSLEQSYRALHKFDEYKVIYKEISNKANLSPALPSKLILYRRLKSPVPGVSDRFVCIQSVYRYCPEHGIAFAVTQDAENKYWDEIPKEVMEGTVRMKVRLGGYVLEKFNARRPMTKITYFVSSDLGGWIPVGLRNLVLEREAKRVENNWDAKKWRGEEPALFNTEDVIENLIDVSEKSRLRRSSSAVEKTTEY